MSEHVLESDVLQHQRAAAGRQHQRANQEQLSLTPLPPDQVIDDTEDEVNPVELITFGTVRETCPHCKQSHLKLVLRQQRVRQAHLFCAECQGCFDAHYPNGAPALTI